MRDWSLKAGDPLALTLAADFRLGKADYVNDHIWEMEIGTGEPAALAVHTTFGLRARGMRLYYRFGELGKMVSNPAEFHRPLQLQRFYPNFFQLSFAPFEDLDITADIWVPESHVLAGRLVVANHTVFARKLNIELCGILTPLDGQPLAPAQQQMVNILAGQSGGLAPVVFITGSANPGAGPHPSLAIGLELDPGATRSLTWAVASEASTEASFELARHVAARSWDAERARIELLDTGSVMEIHTGDQDWDAALAFSQTAALGLFFPSSSDLPQPSFVQSRQPDGGYSHQGDGHDYSPSWNGQAPLDSYYLASLLPAAPHLVRGLIENYLSCQVEGGFIDGKPGLAGQRAKYLAAPLITSLAWNHYLATQDSEFLTEAYPHLLSFFWNWFSPDHDPQHDGIPAWDHVLQTGFEDHPLFDVWHPWSQGVSISILHNPELEALLYREGLSLMAMAQKLDRKEDAELLKAQVARLRASLETGWSENRGMYTYRDRVTQDMSSGRVIARHKGSGNMRPKAEFASPTRLLLEVQTLSPAVKRPSVEIAESSTKNGSGKVEIIGDEFQWRSGGLVATSREVFSKIGRVHIEGLDEKDKFILHSVDAAMQDITLFLPLWAGVPDAARAQTLVHDSLLDADRFDRPYGLPAIPSLTGREAEVIAMSVHLPWNQMIGEGLLAYGFRTEAARLLVHIMNAVIKNLKANRTFYARYHAEKGSGIGERGGLSGLAPVGLFLQTLGVTIHSPTRVRLEGTNPFAWPVTIQHKGLKIIRDHDQTEVIFPNGKSVRVTDPAPLVVTAS